MATTPGSHEGFTPPFPQPFIPAATSMPMCSPPNGLGIELPAHTMWPQNQMVNPAIWAASLPTAARVVYPGMEGSYPLSPIIGGMYDGNKHRGIDSTAYLPISLIPPPGLPHPPFTHSTPNNSPANTPARTRKNLTGAPVRVRFPNAPETGTRAVSDPMAMLAAQARVRQALNGAERVRKAVSVDGNVGDDSTATDGTEVENSEEEDEEEEESLSVDILVHAERRGP